MAQEWHRRLYEGVAVPVPCYAGEFRDSDPRFPELFGYEVQVGDAPGVPSARVPESLAQFEQSLQRAASEADAQLPAGQEPRGYEDILGIVQFAAVVHGEWVLIHPFANGNGRVARLWANWIAVRYGLPPFVRLKPRLEGVFYSAAAQSSMRGDHTQTTAAFLAMLASHFTTPPRKATAPKPPLDPQP